MTDDDLFGLADVDPRVRGTLSNAVLDQHVLRENGVQPIGAILLIRAIRPTRPNAPHGDAIAILQLDRVARCIFERQVLNDEVVGFNLQTFATRCAPLLGKTENGLFHSLATPSICHPLLSLSAACLFSSPLYSFSRCPPVARKIPHPPPSHIVAANLLLLQHTSSFSTPPTAQSTSSTHAQPLLPPSSIQHEIGRTQCPAACEQPPLVPTTVQKSCPIGVHRVSCREGGVLYSTGGRVG